MTAGTQGATFACARVDGGRELCQGGVVVGQLGVALNRDGDGMTSQRCHWVEAGNGCEIGVSLLLLLLKLKLLRLHME